MPNAKRPAGPGRPIAEERDAASEAEQIDEAAGLADDPGRDSTRSARQGERDARAKDDKTAGKSDRDRG